MCIIRKIALLFLITVTLFAQEKKPFWDGFDWRKLDSVAVERPEYVYWMKAGYLAGLFDGKYFYALRVYSQYPALYDSLYQDLLTPLRFKELIPALDQFYRDENNCYLPLPSALIAVRMSALGYPQSEIDDYIIQSKIWLNSIIMKRLLKKK